jgi:hypothetical protein
MNDMIVTGGCHHHSLCNPRFTSMIGMIAVADSSPRFCKKSQLLTQPALAPPTVYVGQGGSVGYAVVPTGGKGMGRLGRAGNGGVAINLIN